MKSCGLFTHVTRVTRDICAVVRSRTTTLTRRFGGFAAGSPAAPPAEPGRPPPAAEIWRDQLSLHQSQQGQRALVIPSPWHTCRRYRRPGQAGLHQRCSSRVVARSGGLVGGRVDRLIGWRNGGMRGASRTAAAARLAEDIYFLLRDHATFLTFHLFATLTVQDHNPFLSVDASG